VLFKDLTHPATEAAFISGSMRITQSSGVDILSVLGCLINCSSGNQLNLNFQIPSSALHQSGAAAVPGIIPSTDSSCGWAGDFG
jgi:hypothetical protein